MPRTRREVMMARVGRESLGLVLALDCALIVARAVLCVVLLAAFCSGGH